MKNVLCSLNDALTFQLESMYDAEKRLMKELPGFARRLSPGAAQLISDYAERSADKRLKLKRIFGYLLTGPFKRTNGVTRNVIATGRDIFSKSRKNSYRDILLLAEMESLVEYKTTSYNTALKIALKLDLTKVVELLEEIISWELESCQKMSDFISQEINQNKSVPVAVAGN